MSERVDVRSPPPRTKSGGNWGSQLCIGFLIDWLDSLGDAAGDAVTRLQKRARTNDIVAQSALGLTGRVVIHMGDLAFTGHNDHALEYSAAYHAQVVGHMDAAELALGGEVYQALYERSPTCISALVNLAEFERRHMREQDAGDLLTAALDRARASQVRRYGVADASWVTSIRCAVALIERVVGEGQALLDAASTNRLGELVTLLRASGSWETAAIAAHQAFSVASPDQQIALHAAMQLAPAHPQPPPAAHARADALSLVAALKKQTVLQLART